MNKKLTLYKEDYSDYSWYKILYDIGFIEYEYEDMPKTMNHKEVRELTIKIGGASIIV